MNRLTVLACLTAVLVGCAGEAADDDDDLDVAEGAQVANNKADLVFAGDKAASGKNAAKPTGSVKGKDAGDTIKISYKGQRIRGCDVGGWHQEITVTFLNKKGEEVGEGLSKTGFSGFGPVPSGRPPELLSAKIPAGAAKVNVLATNNSGGGRCSDTIDGKGWTLAL
jgi:hypothetical protein